MDRALKSFPNPATGFSLSENLENLDALVICIDQKGNVKWSNLFGG